MAKMEKKALAAPDEKRSFDKGLVELVTVGGVMFGRATLQPGWKWSTCVKPVVKFVRDLNRGDQSCVRPFSELVVCPNHYVGALRRLRSNWVTVCNLFGRLDGDLYPKIVLESLCNRRESLATVDIHPDQKLAIGPCEQLERDRAEDRQN